MTSKKVTTKNARLLAVAITVVALSAIILVQLGDGRATGLPISVAEPLSPGAGASSTLRVDVDFDDSQLNGVLGIDSITPIYAPEFISAKESSLNDQSLVIGLSLNGEAKAYPITILGRHEIVNDVIGGVAVLVTWCPVCGTALVHDRRIDSQVHTFGNHGALYLNAMTWFDHETESLWSQPAGVAISGAYKGVQLEMLPASISPWETWKRAYPDTEVLYSGVGRDVTEAVDPFTGDRSAYVAGVALSGQAKAYPYEAVSRLVVVNDHVGDIPVLVYANPADKSLYLYARKLGDSILEFEWANGRLTDTQTHTQWDPATGFGREGLLQNQLLKALPYTTAYLWAWQEFYPSSAVFGP
jgi:hypothetical protein